MRTGTKKAIILIVILIVSSLGFLTGTSIWLLKNSELFMRYAAVRVVYGMVIGSITAIVGMAIWEGRRRL